MFIRFGNEIVLGNKILFFFDLNISCMSARNAINCQTPQLFTLLRQNYFNSHDNGVPSISIRWVRFTYRAHFFQKDVDLFYHFVGMDGISCHEKNLLMRLVNALEGADEGDLILIQIPVECVCCGEKYLF